MCDHHVELSKILKDRCPPEENGRLLLFAVRRVATGGLNDAHVANAFLSAFGLAYRRPLVLLRALMAELSRVSQRKILVAPTCCPRMTGAEGAMMTVISDALDDPHAAHRLLCATLGVENCLGALSSAQALGQAFADLGRPLRS